jgi:hypothetical protein
MKEIFLENAVTAIPPYMDCLSGQGKKVRI